MLKITTTFTADISVAEKIPDDRVALYTVKNVKIALTKMIGADTVDIRNFKVFVHDGKEE